MSKRKVPNPSPNQPSMRAFLVGGSKSWQAGDSPLSDQQDKQQKKSEQNIFESEVHARIVSGGTFHFFQNQASALAYLNGQIILRRSHADKLVKLEKKVRSFQNSGLTKRFLKVPTKWMPQDKYNCQQEKNRAEKVLLELHLLNL